MKGTISQWNDEKGFGFISVSDRKGRLFFHVSSIKTRSRRPEVGDSVSFEIGNDRNGKTRAVSVVIDGLESGTNQSSTRIKVEPPEKGIFDYLLIAIILTSLGYAGYQFYLLNNIETAWPYAVPAIIAFFLTGRSKKPKQEHYSCAKCKAVERFNPRTIEAWNRGITRLFCNQCHQEWIRNTPKTDMKHYSRASSSSGCLGMILILLALPVAGSVAIFQWLA